MNFIDTLNKAHSSGKAFAAAVITASEGTTPRHPGSKMLIYEDGTPEGTIGGGDIEQSVIEDALRCISSRRPLLKTYPVIQSDGVRSGSQTIYIEPVLPGAHLILCGSGHVAGKLIPLAKSVGFRVTVLDIREDAAVRERASAADRFIRCESWSEGLSLIPEHTDQYLIACSFNFTQDEEILSLLLKRKNAYIGMLASPYKRETIYNHLKEQGISDEALARVHSPIGLPIGAETPEEIALSTAAELVQVRSGYNKR